MRTLGSPSSAASAAVEIRAFGSRMEGTSGSFHLGTGVGLALLAKGGGAFLGFLALIVERQRLETERADPADILAVGVERTLRNGQRGRALGHQFLAPLGDLGVELVVRNDDIAEAHFESLLRGVPAAHVPDLARLLLADAAGEVGGAEAGVDRTHAR